MSSKKSYEITGNVEAVWADIESPHGCPSKDLAARMGIEITDIEQVLKQAKQKAANKEVAKHYGTGALKQVFVVRDENGIEVYIHFLYMTEKQRSEADHKLRRQITALQASGKKVAPEYYKRLMLLQNYLLFVENTEKEGTHGN